MIYLHYILKGTKVEKSNNVKEWAEWYEKASKDGARIVKQEHIGAYYVSTVFLGLDHNFGASGDPILFESMVFSDHSEFDLGQEVDCVRYQTYGEALRGHKKLVNEYLEKQSTNIIAWRWFSGRDTVGAVATKTINGWRAYLGVASGSSEQIDVLYIASWGCKLDKATATAIFSELDPDNFDGR